MNQLGSFTPFVCVYTHTEQLPRNCVVSDIIKQLQGLYLQLQRYTHMDGFRKKPEVLDICKGVTRKYT